MNSDRLDIQGMRAVAVVAVLVFHATDMLPGGFLGVDVFFVISGFIIARLALVEIKRTASFSPLKFLQRRLRRLLPPMAIVVLATVAFALLIDTPSRLAVSLPASALAALSASLNVFFLWGATDYFQTFHSNPLLHLWSLAVEIQFYLLFAVTLPMSRWLWRSLHFTRRSAVWTLALLTLSLLLCSVTIELWHRPFGIALPRLFSFFMLPTRLWEFGFGIVAASVQDRFLTRVSRSLAVDLLQVGCALALVLSFKFGSELWYVPGYQALAPCLAVTLLIMTGEGGVVGRALAWRGLTFLGDRSYSIYLWQGPLIVFASMLYATPLAAALAAAAAVLLSILSYEFVEQSFRAAHSAVDGGRAGRFGSVYLVVAVVVVCAAAHFVIAPWVGRYAAPAPLRATELDTVCQRQRGRAGIKPCVYGAARGPMVLLAGDSHAGAVSQAVIDAAEAAGWQTHVATASACALPEYPENIAYRASCAGYADNIVAYARAHQAALVIVDQFSESYIGDMRIGAARWQDGLANFVKTLTDAHIAVLVIADSPRFPLAVARPLWSAEWKVSLASSSESRHTLAQLERAAVEGVAAGRYLSTGELFCDGSTCQVFEHGEWLYTDADHLSIHGAARLTESITVELARISARLAPR